MGWSTLMKEAYILLVNGRKVSWRHIINGIDNHDILPPYAVIANETIFENKVLREPLISRMINSSCLYACFQVPGPMMLSFQGFLNIRLE
jgi:hypothetical protein